MHIAKIAAAVFVLVPTALGQAPNARYELGWRLRALERAWMQVGSWSVESKAVRCKVALPHIEQAVQSFFGGNSGAAGKGLDDARDALIAERGHPHWYDALAVTPARRLCDPKEKALRFEIAEFYEPETMQDIVFTGGVAGEDKYRIDEQLDSFTTDPPWSGELALNDLASGDYQVWTSLFNGDFVEAQRTQTISIVERRDERLAGLEQAMAEFSDKAPKLERETATALLALLKSLTSGSTEETDYPGARLLAECEQVVAAAAKGEAWYGPQHTGEFWLALPTGAKPARVRVFVPNGLARDKPVPLVVALHGAGGSENMFFDTYGDGAIVKLCDERGWLLVAPRVAMFGGAPIHAVVDALAKRYPVDAARIVLVGHSMGAGVGVAAVQKNPAYFRAIAALGGGQGLKNAEKLANLRIFVGAGESDFGRKGAESLHASLVAGGSKLASLKVYPNCEHLMIVAEALPDVFAFFDDALRD